MQSELANLELTDTERKEKLKVFELKEQARLSSYLTRLTTAHFQSLAVIGKGAFGEVFSLLSTSLQH